MIKVSHKKLGIEFHEKRSGEIIHSATSIDNAKAELGYESRVSLEEGVKKFLSY